MPGGIETFDFLTADTVGLKLTYVVTLLLLYCIVFLLGAFVEKYEQPRSLQLGGSTGWLAGGLECSPTL